MLDDFAILAFCAQEKARGKGEDFYTLRRK